MHIIVCVDDRFGMLFNKRRLSSDKKLNARIMELVGEHTLWIHPFSEKLFSEYTDRVRISQSFTEDAQPGDYCFIENQVIAPLQEITESIILCYWNRMYPADTYFPQSILEGFRLSYSEEFSGNSHETLKIERYEK